MFNYSIEQEEFAKLLSSSPSSPVTDTSRRSSVTYSPCLSPTFGKCRQPSIFEFDDPLVTVKTFQGEDLASFTYLPLSPFQSQPYLYEEIDKKSALTKPDERRRKRSSADLRRGNIVQGDEMFIMNSYKDMDQQLESPASIAMPAFLPLRRPQVNSALLDEAFTGIVVGDKKEELEEYRPTALASRTSSRAGRRPQNLELDMTNFFDEVTSCLRPKLRTSTSLTPTNDGFSRKGPFDNNRTRRRGSSLDSNWISSPRTARLQYQEGFPSSKSTESPVFDLSMQKEMSKSKAATILGKHSGNENLLVPGGLSTGEHVYDGVDIPCRSVHLQSDDEDIVKPKKAFINVKAWLKGKKGSATQGK